MIVLKTFCKPRANSTTRLDLLTKVESRTQGSRPRPRTQKNLGPRPRTALTRTNPLEAKANYQGHKRKCPQKKKVFRKNFQAISKKRSLEKIFRRAIEKTVLQKIFQGLHKLLTTQKILLSSTRGQGSFRRLEASRPRTLTFEAKDNKISPRGQERPRGLHLCQLSRLLTEPITGNSLFKWISNLAFTLIVQHVAEMVRTVPYQKLTLTYIT